MSVTRKKAPGEPIPISSQVDWSGALEITYETRGAQGYAWPMIKTADGKALKRVSVSESAEWTGAEVVISTATYRGAGFARDSITIEASTTTEPITANSHFEAIAGTVEQPITTHAIWENRNGVNKFVQWKDDSPHAGIESYLAPEWTATVEWLSEGINSTFQPGNLYTLPSNDAYDDTSGFSWLCTAISQQPHGNAYRISAQLVGAENWPSTIYSTS